MPGACQYHHIGCLYVYGLPDWFLRNYLNPKASCSTTQQDLGRGNESQKSVKNSRVTTAPAGRVSQESPVLQGMPLNPADSGRS